MPKYHFSFRVKPTDDTFYYQHVELEETSQGIQISCDSPDSECVHLLRPDKYIEFCQSIGQDSLSDPIQAARATVKKNKRPVVFSAVHELAEVTFSWYNFDSPFYGDTGVEVSGFPVAPQKKRMYFGLPSDYSNLSESDKEKFVSDFAKQFFPGIEGIEKDIAEIADSEKIVEIPWDPFAES